MSRPRKVPEPNTLTLKQALAQGYSLVGKRFLDTMQRQNPSKKWIALEDLKEEDAEAVS
jgi:hypothetical protein